MHRSCFLALLLLLSPAVDFAREAPGVEFPAFTTVPELSAGFDMLYERSTGDFRLLGSNPEEPFGEVAIAASYLFEKLSHQGVLIRTPEDKS